MIVRDCWMDKAQNSVSLHPEFTCTTKCDFHLPLISKEYLANLSKLKKVGNEFFLVIIINCVLPNE